MLDQRKGQATVGTVKQINSAYIQLDSTSSK